MTFLIKGVLIRYLLLSLITGALAPFSYPPFGLIFLMPLSLIIFLNLLFYCPKKSKEAFFMGYFYGFGYYLSGLYWIGHAFYVLDLKYLVPLGTFLIPLFLAFFVGIVTSILFFFKKKVYLALGFTLLWSIWEWILGHWIFGGFPWNLMGYIWWIPILQTTAWIGIYGLSFLTVFIFSLFFLLNYKSTLISLIILWISFSIGIYRLTNNKVCFEGTQKVNIRLIQPCINQKNKWNSKHFEENLARHLFLSKIKGEKKIDIVIWPESSIPLLLDENSWIYPILGEILHKDGFLIFGAPRNSSCGNSLYVSLFIINHYGQVMKTYDKSHLVPFGEYIPPFIMYFINKSFFRYITPINFVPGENDKIISVDKLPKFISLICFEAIFSGEVPKLFIKTNKEFKNRPVWILNITNDSWYGTSPGPYQHFYNARVRSIEEGIPLIRSANHGISAVIDPLGRILSCLYIDEIGYIDSELPEPLSEPTFYNLYKDKFFFIALFINTLFLLFKLGYDNNYYLLVILRKIKWTK